MGRSEKHFSMNNVVLEPHTKASARRVQLLQGGVWREGLLPFAEVIYVGHNTCNPLSPSRSPPVTGPMEVPQGQPGWGGTTGQL